MATEKDKYRKPNVGMFNLFQKIITDVYREKGKLPRNPLTVIDMKNSFYCGDNYDGSDESFAANIGLKFYLPSEQYKTSIIKGVKLTKNYYIMVGMPASGKNTFIETYMKDFSSASRDDLGGSESKCKELVRTFIEEKKKIVVNNTHPSVKSRKVFLDIFHENDIRDVGCIWLDVDSSIAKSRNSKRDKKIPTIAFSMFIKYFEKPTLEEGFTEVIRISS